MSKEENKTDGDINIHGLADHQALRKMGTERLKELLDQTYEMRKNHLASKQSINSSSNNYINEWINVVEEELERRENSTI